jgi:hypothetical protein
MESPRNEASVDGTIVQHQPPASPPQPVTEISVDPQNSHQQRNGPPGSAKSIVKPAAARSAPFNIPNNNEDAEPYG